MRKFITVIKDGRKFVLDVNNALIVFKSAVVKNSRGGYEYSKVLHLFACVSPGQSNTPFKDILDFQLAELDCKALSVVNSFLLSTYGVKNLFVYRNEVFSRLHDVHDSMYFQNETYEKNKALLEECVKTGPVLFPTRTNANKSNIITAVIMPGAVYDFKFFTAFTRYGQISTCLDRFYPTDYYSYFSSRYMRKAFLNTATTNKDAA